MNEYNNAPSNQIALVKLSNCDTEKLRTLLYFTDFLTSYRPDLNPVDHQK